MDGGSLFLTSYGFNKFIQHKSHVESCYNVSISLPDVAETTQDFLSNDLLLIQFHGSHQSVHAASEHIKSLVTPEKSVPFYFPTKLECIFRCIGWLRVLSKIHNVDIKTYKKHVTVSGSSLDTQRALTAMEILNCEFRNYSSKNEPCNSREPKVVIPADMLVPPMLKQCFRCVQHFPKPVIEILLSWMKKALGYEEPKSSDASVIILEDSVLEESVIVLEQSPKTFEVVTLSDEETDDIEVQEDINDRVVKNGNNQIQGERRSDLNQHIRSNLILENGQHEAQNEMVNARKPFLRDKIWVTGNQERRKNKSKRKLSSTNTAENPGNQAVNRNKRAKLQNIESSVASTSGTYPLPVLPQLDPSKNQTNNSHQQSATIQIGDCVGLIPVFPAQNKTFSHHLTTQNVPQPVANKNRRLRPIVIDGSNVARCHGKNGRTFSCKGIELCINFFVNRGHENVVAFVPQHRRRSRNPNIIDHDIIERLATLQRVVFTPSRRIKGRSVSSYDDRFIVRLATENGGVIVSNDFFRDIMHENDDWTRTIEERLLMFCFVGDIFMIPDDPLGVDGPTIDEFLSFPAS